MRIPISLLLTTLSLLACQDPKFDNTWELEASIRGPRRCHNYKGDPPERLVMLRHEDYDDSSQEPFFMDGPLDFKLYVCNTGRGENILPLWEQGIGPNEEWPDGMAFDLFKVAEDGSRQSVPRQSRWFRFSADSPTRHEPKLLVWRELRFKTDSMPQKDPSETRCTEVLGFELREIFEIRSFGNGSYILEGKIEAGCPFLPPGIPEPRAFTISERPKRLR